MVDVPKISAAATYGGSVSAVFFGLTSNEFAALGGLAIGIIGLIISTWYKHQHLKIAKENQKANSEE